VGDPLHPSGGQHRLVVLRHAKSDWPPGVPDEERPLSPRGRRDAKAVGVWLAEHDVRPDAVLCSPANRTRETWARVSQALESSGGAPEATYDESIYEASVKALQRVLRGAPAKARTVLLIGHNPGVHDLVVQLAHGRDEKAKALAAASFPKPWTDLDAGSATLEVFEVPRG
jgi:phosphohistidine phosphatase